MVYPIRKKFIIQSLIKLVESKKNTLRDRFLTGLAIQDRLCRFERETEATEQFEIALRV